MSAPHVTSADARIADGDFLRLREFFYRRTGIWFDEGKRYFVDKRVLARMAATEARSFREYFGLLRFQANETECQALINSLTVNETYFFREDYQFTCLVSEVLPELTAAERDGRPIRIWSLPSSTGEEPYSIALFLLEYWPDLDAHEVELLASDIDSEVLAHARRGIYSQRSVQHLPGAVLERHFQRLGDGRFQLSAAVREVVDFTRVNVTDPEAMRAFRDIDVVFCRNLLIYFDDASRRRAVEAIYDALAPGGFVFLGHSEHMSRISALYEVRRMGKLLVYQKPRAAGARP